MSTVKDIEQAITRLSREELAALRTWFHDFDADAWDRQIENNAHSGQLDALFESLKEENEGHPDIPLDEVLNEEKLP